MLPSLTQEAAPESAADRNFLIATPEELRAAVGIFGSTDFNDGDLSDQFDDAAEWLGHRLGVLLVNRQVVDRYFGWGVGSLELSAQSPYRHPISLNTFTSVKVEYFDGDGQLETLAESEWTLDVTGDRGAVLVDVLPAVDRRRGNPVSISYLYRAPEPAPGIKQAALLVFKEMFNALQGDADWRTPALERRVDSMCAGYGRNFGVG